MARSNRLNLINWAFWSMAISVTLLPIGLGGDRPIPLGIAQMSLAFSCLFLAAHHEVWGHLRFFTRVQWALGFFVVIVLWTFFQTLPIAPPNWAHPLWLETRAVLGGPARGSIAVDPEDALKGLSRLLTYLATGVLAYVLAQDIRRGRKLLQLIWWSGVAICTYGLVIYLTGDSSILWFQKWAYMDDLTATFVNRNHFAIYAGMVFMTGIAYLMQSWGREVQGYKVPSTYPCDQGLDRPARHSAGPSSSAGYLQHYLQPFPRRFYPDTCWVRLFRLFLSDISESMAPCAHPCRLGDHHDRLMPLRGV